MYNLNHLKYFYHCAQHESVSKAAEKLRIAQPSLSSQIKLFENQIGFQLFVRTGKGLKLTPRGHDLYKKVSKVFDLTNDIDSFIKNEEQDPAINFEIGVTDEIERPFVADIVGKLIKSQSEKQVTASIVSGSHAKIAESAFQGEFDVIISDRKIKGLKLMEEFSLPVYLISAKNMFQIKLNSNSNASKMLSLLEQDLVSPTPDILLGKETDHFLREQNYKSHIAIQSNILACLIRSVSSNVGAAFLPILYVNKEVSSGLLHAYGPRGGYWKHQILLYTTSRGKTSHVQVFAKIIKNLTQDLI